MKRAEPLISVIVPVYNGQDYLENCVKSIETQTYGNLEVIIVNDGSTDRTGEVCAVLQKEYKNVRELSLQDEGVSAARNAGIEAAEGELITFVDADDRLRPDMLQILYECMTGTGSDVAGCQFFTWRNGEEWRREVGGRKAADGDRCLDIGGAVACEPDASVGKSSMRNGPVSEEDSRISEMDGMAASESRENRPAAGGNIAFAADEQISGEIKIYTPDRYLKEALLCGNSRCWSKLYRKEILEKVRFRERLTIGEDMLFLVKLLPFVSKIVETEYPGYGYFQNPAGAINREFTPRYMDQITCWQLARQEVLRMEPELDAQVTALLIIGIMLTAGKLAVLPAAERRKNQEYVRDCHKALKEALRVSGAYGRLSAGYRAKAALFSACPGVYLWLYHMQKAVRIRHKE